MKKDGSHTVDFSSRTSTSSSSLNTSILRYWRQCHRSQRELVVAFFLILIIIYIGYYKTSSAKVVGPRSIRSHSTIINTGEESRLEQPTEKNQLIKVEVTKQIFSTPTNERQTAVRDAMRHAWKAYRTYAWGKDELKPISKTASVWFGLGLTIVDAIDTLFIMNMTEEYDQARLWIANSFDVDSSAVDKLNSHFEITIRILGGLLSIYHLTADEIFLKRATEIGDRLLMNFKTKSGLPAREINIKRCLTEDHRYTSHLITAEVGTVQLEMRDLARVTAQKKYEDAAEKSSTVLHIQPTMNGLVPLSISALTGRFAGGLFSFGANGDSYYEYLLKQWLQTGRKRSTFWNDWIESIEGVRKYLWRVAYPEPLYFVGELKRPSSFFPKMDHLACFLAGNLALGWYFQRDLTYLLDMGKNLTETCYQMYAKQATGLSPEIAHFSIGPSLNGSTMIVRRNEAHNLLRPETIESFYYLYHITGDEKYQEWGWKIFQSFEKYTRQKDGYSTIDNVRDQTNVRPRDKMESFFLAETLKYFYLLFEKKNLFPFDRWIFNTEAHPLPIYNT